MNDRAARDVGGEELEGLRDVMMNDDVDMSPLSRTTMIKVVYSIILCVVPVGKINDKMQ